MRSFLLKKLLWIFYLLAFKLLLFFTAFKIKSKLLSMIYKALPYLICSGSFLMRLSSLKTILPPLRFLLFFKGLKKKDCIYLFLERGKEGERQGEKHQCVVASHTPPTGDLAHNPGMHPDWESNTWPLGSWAGAQSTKPHQLGLSLRFLILLLSLLGLPITVLVPWDQLDLTMSRSLYQVVKIRCSCLKF